VTRPRKLLLLPRLTHLEGWNAIVGELYFDALHEDRHLVKPAHFLLRRAT